MQLLLQLNLMSNLIIFLHQIETFLENWIVFVSVFPYLHQYFNHVLNTMADGAFVKNRAESFKDRSIGFGRVFSDIRANLAREAYSDFNRVICGAFKEEDEDLEGDNFMRNCLIDQMSDECRS